jgi:hypothetical protein
MKQREHETLDDFAVIKKPSPPKPAPNYRSTRFRQPAFDIFHVAAGRRIGEKNPAFSVDIDHNGPGS